MPAEFAAEDDVCGGCAARADLDVTTHSAFVEEEDGGGGGGGAADGDGMIFYARMRSGDNWSCDTHVGHMS
jgi:hypothetical protein